MPGAEFGKEGYLRLSFATSMEVIKKGVERIQKAACFTRIIVAKGMGANGIGQSRFLINRLCCYKNSENRRSIRKFKAEPVPEDILYELLDAARALPHLAQMPSHGDSRLFKILKRKINWQKLPEPGIHSRGTCSICLLCGY